MNTPAVSWTRPARPLSRATAWGVMALMLIGCAGHQPADTGPGQTATPGVGDVAPDFSLDRVGGEPVTLSELAAEGPVVMLVLRGYPGYQCPICSRQVADYINHADAFDQHDATVLMIYPGPAENLEQRAEQFIADADLPDHFVFVIDPGYRFTNQYGLRWDQPKETAYPSTFVINRDRGIEHAHISRTHGNRTAASDILDILDR